MAYPSQSQDELNQYANQQTENDAYYYGNSSLENYSTGYYSSSSSSSSPSLVFNSFNSSANSQSNSPTNQFYCPTATNDNNNQHQHDSHIYNYFGQSLANYNYYGYYQAELTPREACAYTHLTECESEEESDLDTQDHADDFKNLPILDLQSNPMDSIQIELTNKSLWQKFHVHTLEMILTKPGRKMFPTIQYIVKGLDPVRRYNIYIDMVQVTPHTWK